MNQPMNAMEDTMPPSVLKKLEAVLALAIGPNKNLARELADLLNLSQESIYRRFRGDTSFTLNEAWILQKHYNVSIDELFDNNGKIGVNFSPFYKSDFVIESYLTDIYRQMSILSKEKKAKLYVMASDVPLFRFFGYPGLTQFKLFYWRNLIHQAGTSDTDVFHFVEQANHPISEEIHTMFRQIDVDEVWSRDTLNGTINQIEYYYDCGLMANDQTLFMLYGELLQLVQDLVYGDQHSKLTLHHYELALNNNSFYVETGQSRMLAIAINGVNSLQTRDERIINDYRKWLKTVISKSLKISGQSLKQKFALCNWLRSRITASAEDRLPSSMVSKLHET